MFLFVMGYCYETSWRVTYFFFFLCRQFSKENSKQSLTNEFLRRHVYINIGMSSTFHWRSRLECMVDLILFFQDLQQICILIMKFMSDCQFIEGKYITECSMFSKQFLFGYRAVSSTSSYLPVLFVFDRSRWWDGKHFQNYHIHRVP